MMIANSGLFSKKHKLILLTVILLVFVLGIHFFVLYLSSVKICEPIEISVEGISNEDSHQIAFYGYTPFNRVLKLEFNDSLRWVFRSYGSFTDLNVSGDQSVMHKISLLVLTIGDVKYTLNPEFNGNPAKGYDLIRYIDYTASKTDILKSILHWNVMMFLFIAAGILIFIILSLRAERRFAIGHNVISLYRSLHLRIMSGHSRLISIRFNLFNPAYIFLLCLILVLVYSAWFFPKTDYSDTVYIQGDSWYYQMRGVNLAYGKGLLNTTFFEKYAFNPSDIHKSTGYEYFKNGGNSELLIPWCPPAYPIFLAIVYKTFGVSPRMARYMQLLLLIFVAAFLPLFGYCLWKGKGVLIGTVTGLLFILRQYTQAGEIMTESLQIFLIFILLFAFHFYNKRKSLLTSVFIGVLLAFNLLVKGIIIFVPLFYFFYLFKNDNYSLSTFIRTKWLMLVTFVFVVALWTFYLNSINGCIEKVKEEKDVQELRELSKEIITFSESSQGFISSKEYYNQLYELVNRKTPKFNSALQVLEENVVKNQALTEQQKIDSLNVIIKLARESLFDAPVAGIKILGQTYIFHPKSFMLISSNTRRTLMEANCMRSINGDVIVDVNIKYTYDGHYNWSPMHRVLHFYWNNPQVIPVILPNKLFRGFSSFPFFILLFVLMIFDFSLHLGKRIRIHTVWWLIPLALFFILIIPAVVMNKTFFILCLSAGITALVLSYLLKIRLIIFDVPFYLNMFILNFVLIAMIHFGLDRFNSIVNFIIILTVLYYFSEIIETTAKRIIKTISNGTHGS